MKQNKVTSHLPWESRHGVPSSVFRAILIRVACPNPVSLELQLPRFKTESTLCASKNWTRVCGREKGAAVLNVTGLND